MKIWGLFDDGNGSYSNAVAEYNKNRGGSTKLYL
jgi:hypothetical protein